MITKNDVTIRYTKGTGPGGQHKNKVATCVVMTHNATGITVRIDGRSRERNEARAYQVLAKRIAEAVEAKRAEQRKAKRDYAIANEERIRTYDFTKGLVTDHRSGKTATIKNVLTKGKIELLRNKCTNF
jgi:protein subunit release factor A